MTETTQKDYYEILQVGNKASQDDIKREFRKLALKYHPDKNPGDSAAAVRFQELNEAYSLLSDVQKRKDYDREREQATEVNSVEPLSDPSFTFTAEELRQSFRSSSYCPDVSRPTSTSFTTTTTTPCGYSVDPILFQTGDTTGSTYGPVRTKKKRSDPWRQKSATEANPTNVPKKRGRPPKKASMPKQSASSSSAPLPNQNRGVMRNSYEALMATHRFMFQFLSPNAAPTPAIPIATGDPSSMNRSKTKVSTKTFATTPVFATM